MSILDKVNTLQKILDILFPVLETVLKAIVTIIEKVGDTNANG